MKSLHFLTFLLFLGLFPLKAQNKHTAEDFVKVTPDGAWCWFSDPRAIYMNGTYYGGFVDSIGSIWSFSYQPETQEAQQIKLFDKLNKDDHANPSIIALPDGKMAMFFSAHGGMKSSPIYYRVTTNKGDISQWDSVQSIIPKVDGPRGTCYTNPVMLSSEKNRMYLFFRGTDFKPNFISSDNLKDWTQARPLIKDQSTDDKANMVRPYVKIASNNQDRIHFAFTDGHPRNEYQNSIYYMCYRNGAFETASGKKIGSMEEIPFAPSTCDKVYDASKNNNRAWIWDIAYDSNDRPVMVYARFESELKHSYWYAYWDGQQWQNQKITDAGHWFPNGFIPRENAEPEPHYSGGIYLDHNNPQIVYLSRPINNVFEIQRWTTTNGGKTWNTDTITQNSSCDNVRPFVARNDPDSRVLWMYNYQYRYFTNYQTAIRINDIFKGYSSGINKKDIQSVMKKVADWQIDNFEKGKKTSHDYGNKSWTNAALYFGMAKWAGMTNDDTYYKWLNRIGSTNYWQVADRMYHADDICISQMYLEMYNKTKTKSMIIPTLARVDWVIAHPSTSGLKLDYSDAKTLERWSWCDALFMAPPVYARLYSLTGDKKYFEFMDKEFRCSYDSLYDKEEDLFYRDLRYLGQKEANGQKVFWGRGNGWVLGGLVNVLDALPKEKRSFYEELFRKMSKRIAGLQSQDGYWHASLLDPASYPAPETSSSAFIVYALAYGINTGLLDKATFLPVVEKGWTALVKAVNEEGKLGWVQPVGADPRNVTRDMTEVYGVGAFLLAGTEMYKLAK